MLVLSRRVGERICIGDGIVVTVVSTRGRQVQVGIEAPRHVPVLREELVAGPEKGREAANAHPQLAGAVCSG